MMELPCSPREVGHDPIETQQLSRICLSDPLARPPELISRTAQMSEARDAGNFFSRARIGCGNRTYRSHLVIAVEKQKNVTIHLSKRTFIETYLGTEPRANAQP
jgi:hypothetical protein